MTEPCRIYTLADVLSETELVEQPYGRDTMLNGPMLAIPLAHQFAEMSDGERKSCTLSAIALARRGDILIPLALEAILDAYNAPPLNIREGL